MKNMITGTMIAVALAAAMSTAAMAQTATQDVTITATVPAFCTINGGATGTARTASINSQITNGQVTGGALTLVAGNSPAVCNKNTDITMSSLTGTGVTSAANAGAIAPFVNKIQYTATAALGTGTATYASATNTAVAATTGGAVSAPLAITVTTVSTAPNYLAAGTDYTDTLTVTLTPQP